MSKGKGTPSRPPPAKIRRLSTAADRQPQPQPPPLENPTSPTLTHRSSFLSSPERDREARAVTTPKRTPKSPFRSLRTRLRSFGLGSASSPAAPTSTSKRPASLGSRPASAARDGWASTTRQRSVRGKTVSGPVSVVPGGAARLKGYHGPAGSRPNAALTAAAAEAAAGTVGRSVSLPANLAARAGGEGEDDDDDDADFDEQRRRADEVLPALLWRTRSEKRPQAAGADDEFGRVSEFGALVGGAVSPLSVDEFLAAQMPLRSPPLLLVSPVQSTTSDVGAQRPLPNRDRSPKPGLRSIQIPPRSGSGLSPNPPSSIARFLRSPTPEQQHGEAAERPSSPTSLNHRPPLMPPQISSDFVRQSDDLPLSALRARQVAETEAIARDLAARDPSHRNSRILPGATLPMDWATQTLVRSKTVGAVTDRWRDPYAAEGDVNGGKGSSSQGSSSLRRSSSDSPLLPQSDVMRNVIASTGRQGENERGFSLGRVAGRRQSSMINHKTHARTVSVPTTRNEQAAGRRHSNSDSEDSPFKQPFPSEFEEVPFRRAAHFRPSPLSTAHEEANLPMSPSTPATPHLPQIVEVSPPPTTAPGSPDPGSSSSKPSSNAAGENGKSPLMDMIEQLQAHPTSRNNAVSAPIRSGGAFRGSSAGRQMFARGYALAAGDPEDAMENLDDSPYEEEYRHRDRNTSTQSEGGYPFPLAGYLDSAAPSRSASTDAGQVRPGPPASLVNLPSRHAGITATTARSPPAPTSLTSASDRDGFLLRSPLGGANMRAFLDPDSPDRSITMEQMEREIAQMEAELAASGTPRSMYDSPYLSSIRSPAVGDEEPESPSPPGSRITPRSAKRWSLIEMERAYERMKNLLASSNERQRSLSHDERAFGLDSVPEVLSAHDSPSVAARTDGGASREGEPPDQASCSPKPSALRERRLADQRDSGVVPLGESGGPLTVVANKPLPGLPASSPRKPLPPYSNAKPSGLPIPLADAVHASLSGLEQTVETPGAAQQEKVETADEAVDIPEPEASAAPARAASAELASGQRGNLAHRRTGSESRIRQLYLPLRHKSTRDSMLSVAGIDDMLSELGSPVTEEAPKRSSGHSETMTTTPPPPLSPSQGQRLPTSARSSRLARYELRSGAGRELQRRLGQENTAPPVEPVEPLSPMRRQVPVVRRVSSRLSSSRLQRAAGELSAEEGNRQTGESSTDGGVTTWYPISPGRDRPLQLSSDGSDSNGTAPTGYDNGRRRRRRSSETPKGVPARPALNVARVRTMDKLELYLEYVAIRSDLEKAELERAAVFDALRETRAVLADVRRQRDAAEQELRILRAAGPLDVSPTESTHAWRERAQQALRDVEILRHELLESRAREKEALARDGGGGGEDTSAVSPPLRTTRSFVSPSLSELSRTGGTTTPTVAMQQGSFPRVSNLAETRARDHQDDHGGPVSSSSSSSSEAHGRSPLSAVDDLAGTPHNNTMNTAFTRAPKDSFASSLDSTVDADADTNDHHHHRHNVGSSSSSSANTTRNRLSALSLFHASDFVSPLMNQTMNFIVGGLGSSGSGGAGRHRDSVVREQEEGAKSSFGSGTGTGASEAASSSPLKGRVSSSAGLGRDATTTTATTTTTSAPPTLMGRSLSALGFPGLGLGPVPSAADEDQDEAAAARAGAKTSTSTVGTTTTTATTTTTTSSGHGGGDWSVESTTLVNPDEDHFEGGLGPDLTAQRRGGHGGGKKKKKKWLRDRDEAFLSDLTTPPSLGGSAVVTGVEHVAAAWLLSGDQEEEEEDLRVRRTMLERGGG